MLSIPPQATKFPEGANTAVITHADRKGIICRTNNNEKTLLDSILSTFFFLANVESNAYYSERICTISIYSVFALHLDERKIMHAWCMFKLVF